LVAALAGLVDVLFPDAFKGHGTPLAIGTAVLAIAYGLYRAWPRPIQHTYSAPNTTIRIVEGDLLAETGHTSGERSTISLGNELDGWTDARAEDELADVPAQIRVGIWQPPPKRGDAPAAPPNFPLVENCSAMRAMS
jgi:hypothetical protein